MKIILAFFLITFSSLNIFAQSKITKEEYAVYTAVFEKSFEKIELDKAITKIAILENSIEPDYMLLDRYLTDKRTAGYLFPTGSPITIVPSDWSESLKDLREANKNSEKLAEQFAIKYKYNLVTKSEIEALLEEGKIENNKYYKNCDPCSVGNPYVWQPFYRKYRNSGGYYGLSKVGFSKNKKLATVFIESKSGDYNSKQFYIAYKTDDNWKIYNYFGSAQIID